MAINQEIAAPPDLNNESQGSTQDTSSSDEKNSSCSEYEGEHADMEVIIKRIGRRRRRRSTRSRASYAPYCLGASPACCKKEQLQAIAITDMNAESTRMMKCLQSHLSSLRSLLPPSARSHQLRDAIVDAVRYRKALEKEIQSLLAALPYFHQVDVRRVECGGLQIGIICKKKSGLMVALMEAMESFGLHFANVSVSCQDDKIIIDALSTQDGGEKAGALKGMLIATIIRFNESQ